MATARHCSGPDRHATRRHGRPPSSHPPLRRGGSGGPARRCLRRRSPSTRRPNPPQSPPRVLFINQYYWPDHASTAQHLTDLAESLAAQGFECHVLASQGRYKPGEPPPGFEIHQGVHIHRVPATSLGRRATWSRMADYLSFYAGAAAKALALAQFDLVVTLTTPPIIGLIGTILKRLRGSKHIYWSMDLHPDASMALGRMSPTGRFGRLMYALSRFVYRRADQVVVLGPYMADRIALKQVAPEKIATIPVWSRRDEIYPVPGGQSLRNPSAWTLRSSRCTRATWGSRTRSTSSSKPPAACASDPTSCSSSLATARARRKCRRLRYRGARQHPPDRSGAA